MQFGIAPFFVVAPAAITGIVYSHHLATFAYVAENQAHVDLNFALLGGLGALYVAWALALSRGWVDETSGVGFALMGYAVAARVYCEFLVIFPNRFVDFATDPTGLGTSVRTVRAAALFAYAFGLATIAAAVWADRRERRKP